ncbi:DUF460 domain-containing protein [Candidatus Woesearchaeota archaeon]|nr:DUF460 domain-containing protein [Candidatus Woesearchaeota archaeon]
MNQGNICVCPDNKMMRMYEKPLLIVGIDPGTTAAYALLDLEGKLLEVSSSRELSLASMIFAITERGIPVLIGTDKARVPDFVEKFAVKTGARVMSPNSDLSVRQKKELAKANDYSNDHEMDALAGAVFALKRKRSLIRKIDRFITKEGKENIRNRVSELVLKNEDLSIRNAAQLLENPRKQEKLVVKALDEQKVDEKEYLRLYTDLKRLRKDHMLLRESYDRIKQQNRDMRKKIQYFQHKISNLSSDEHLKIRIARKEERLQNLYGRVDAQHEEIQKLNSRMKSQYSMLSEAKSSVFLKKLRNLGWDEFEKKEKMLSIDKGDVLMVEDPNEYSQRTLDHLKNMVETIVFRKKPAKSIISNTAFTFIDAKKLEIKEDALFASVNRSELEKARSDIDILSRIVMDYRKQRSKE